MSNRDMRRGTRKRNEHWLVLYKYRGLLSAITFDGSKTQREVRKQFNKEFEGERVVLTGMALFDVA